MGKQSPSTEEYQRAIVANEHGYLGVKYRLDTAVDAVWVLQRTIRESSTNVDPR
jgi:hypothetical protein